MEWIITHGEPKYGEDSHLRAHNLRSAEWDIDRTESKQIIKKWWFALCGSG